MAYLDRETGRVEELWILALAVAAIAGSFILQPSEHGGLSVTVPLLGTRISLPEACMSRRIFGISCPGCGLTRSFVATARGDFRSAVKWNAMGPVLFVVVLFQIPYRALEYLGIWRHRKSWRRIKEVLGYIMWPLCGGLIIMWLVRLC